MNSFWQYLETTCSAAPPPLSAAVRSLRFLRFFFSPTRPSAVSSASLLVKMDEEPGMSMMLSAIASPIDDDPWNFADGPSFFKHELCDALDSAAQSPSSSLFDDDVDASSYSSSLAGIMASMESDANSGSLLLGLPDPNAAETVPKKKPVVRRRARECSMVCWLFRTLLTSEYRALPLNAIFEIFEETLQNPLSSSGRHWRQSIRHCLSSSIVFVRVLTPNPRKDFLVMNEAGSWWTVHPDCELACAEHVFRVGVDHRCPPSTSLAAYCSRLNEAKARPKWADLQRSTSVQLLQQPRLAVPLRQYSSILTSDISAIDHEEEYPSDRLGDVPTGKLCICGEFYESPIGHSRALCPIVETLDGCRFGLSRVIYTRSPGLAPGSCSCQPGKLPDKIPALLSCCPMSVNWLQWIS
ncbi:unnamed protein product [Caenorhabditis auriculariae]|uniref:Fork-head domain-containing protein n=1 Tax=Caenorhabditis auriculariae TaxID=2777116 RepID=A0A8S1GTC2_9PELO|nr:unnamed protein product [Caenorhabditis auriculariae]